PDTTPTKKARIVAWKREGKSHDWIREHLTGRHDISDRQIIRIFKRYGEEENYYDVGHRSGRPRKLGEQETRVAARHLANSTANNATDVQRQFFPEVHPVTVKRRLREIGLEPHLRADVPFIS
ncbi:hypothetical protein B0H17DRAFT_884495, partial [Mycena rosella]